MVERYSNSISQQVVVTREGKAYKIEYKVSLPKELRIVLDFLEPYYKAGTFVDVIAIANPYYTFDRWDVDVYITSESFKTFTNLDYYNINWRKRCLTF